jgi:hypothetical protein
MLRLVPLLDVKWESLGGRRSLKETKFDLGRNRPFSLMRSSACRKADSGIGSELSNNPPDLRHYSQFNWNFL